MIKDSCSAVIDPHDNRFFIQIIIPCSCIDCHTDRRKRQMTEQPPITDSPWLWFALFSAVGLTALLATGGKFGNRQANIERKGQARAAVAAGSVEVTVDGTGRKSATGVPNYSKPGMTEIRLVPLACTIGTLLVVSLVLLARERLSHRSAKKTLRDADTG